MGDVTFTGTLQKKRKRCVTAKRVVAEGQQCQENGFVQVVGGGQNKDTKHVDGKMEGNPSPSRKQQYEQYVCTLS